MSVDRWLGTICEFESAKQKVGQPQRSVITLGLWREPNSARRRWKNPLKKLPFHLGDCSLRVSSPLPCFAGFVSCTWSSAASWWIEMDRPLHPLPPPFPPPVPPHQNKSRCATAGGEQDVPTSFLSLAYVLCAAWTAPPSLLLSEVIPSDALLRQHCPQPCSQWESSFFFFLSNLP